MNKVKYYSYVAKAGKVTYKKSYKEFVNIYFLT